MRRLQTIAVILFILFPITLLGADKVVVVPLKGGTKSGNGKVLGEGRVAAGLMTMQTSSGYCEMPSGIKYALSTHLSDWNSAPSVCPANTWVCREADVSGHTPCGPPTGAKYINIACNGSLYHHGDPLFLHGWLADAGTPTAKGRYMTTDSVSGIAVDGNICISYFIWCCWQ